MDLVRHQTGPDADCVVDRDQAFLADVAQIRDYINLAMGILSHVPDFVHSIVGRLACLPLC
jgi:hypothetical protein